MNNRFHLKKFNKGFLVFVVAWSLFGCGGAEQDQVPTNARIDVGRSEVTWDVGSVENCGLLSGFGTYHDHLVQVTVYNDEGSPLSEINTRFTIDLAGNTFNGGAVLYLFHDINDNGVVDEQDPLVSWNGSPAFDTTTSRYLGTATVIVRMNLDCTYRGSLNVFAGGMQETITFEVTNESEGEAEGI